MRDGPPFPINLSIKTQKSIPKRGEGGRREEGREATGERACSSGRQKKRGREREGGLPTP